MAKQFILWNERQGFIIAEIHEALEKAQEAIKYKNQLPKEFVKPFIVILKRTKDLQQAIDATEYIMELSKEIRK